MAKIKGPRKANRYPDEFKIRVYSDKVGLNVMKPNIVRNDNDPICQIHMVFRNAIQALSNKRRNIYC